MFSLLGINQNSKLIFIKVYNSLSFLSQKKTEFSSLGPNDIQVRLLCIPSFAQSNSCIALNIRTLDCYEISFENEALELVQ